MTEPEQKASSSGARPGGTKKDALVGQVVAGRYRILALIGRGGMGNVYRARQEPLGRVVAVKALRPDYPEDQDPEFVRRFMLEATAASKLNHPKKL